MKRSWTVFYIGIALSFVVMGKPAEKSISVSEDVQSFARMKELFADPPAEFRVAPLWVWNGIMTREVIDRQLAEFKEQGMGGVFIHPRPGLVTPYLSQEWFDLCRYSLETGKKLGLKVWIYDENSYPSGFAGGHVPAEMPEAYNQGQGLELIRATVLRLEAKDDSYAVVLKKGPDDRYLDITDRLPEENGKMGDYLLFRKTFFPKKGWHGGFSYVDILLPGVTEKFLELTMKGYERAMGAEFGRWTPGIFTDEPGIQTPGRNQVRWTPDLFARFLTRWNYDLRPHLLSLFEETGEWRRIRHNYHQLMLELFIERWAKPYYEYCRQHELALTGHYWEHEWPNPHLGPDNMAMYLWHQVPAIDLLFNQFRTDVHAQFGNVRAVKELSSVANQTGRRRTLSENYGAAGWELRFHDMKRLGDWSYALGVNFTNPHLSYQTLMGARKYDHPQSFSYHEPWWSHFHHMADYLGRLSLALSAGEQVNRVLVIEPTTSAWMHASMDRSSPRLREIGDQFQNFLNTLEAEQIEYDLGSESILQEIGSVDKNCLLVGKRSYEVVVLPPGTENLSTSTVALLESYLQNHGKVLCFMVPPARIDGAPSDRIQNLAKSHPAEWAKAETIHDLQAITLLAESDLEIKVSKGDDQLVFHHRRRLSDGQLLFLVNSGVQLESQVFVRIKGGSVFTLYPDTGKIERNPTENSGGYLSFSLSLLPTGSRLLYISHKVQPDPPPIPPSEMWTTVPPDGPLQIKRLDPNTLKLDYCNVRIAGNTWNDVYAPTASGEIFKHFGFSDGNPWNTAVQYRTSILDRNRFPADSGFEADFPFLVDLQWNPSSLQAVVERPDLWKVSVNGKPVSPNPGQWFLDRDFAVYDIGSSTIHGMNTITLKAAPMSVHHELEPVMLLGDFGVVPQTKGWQLVPPADLSLGPWKDQALPFYGSAVSYSAFYSFSPKVNRYLLAIREWNGVLAEIRIDGKETGLIAWPPFTFELTPHVKEGTQKVEVVVYGSLKNLLGPHHNKPTPGMTGPATFLAAPKGQPGGSEYDLLPYGLFKPFQVGMTAIAPPSLFDEKKARLR